MSVSLDQLLKKCADLLFLVRGSPQTLLTHISPPQRANKDSLVFVTDLSHLESFKKSLSQNMVPSAVVLAQSLGDREFENLSGSFALLRSSHVKLVMAIAGKTFFPPEMAIKSLPKKGIHPTALIDPSAQLGEGVAIGPYVVVGPEVQIEDHVTIGPHCVIEAGCILGANSHLHAQVFLAHSTLIGRFCEILPQTSLGTEGFGYATDAQGLHHRITHYGRLILEDSVHVGSCVSIDRGTFEDSVIGSGTKIDNYCHLGHNIVTGKNCFIAAGFISAGSVKLGNYNMMGGRTTVAGHLNVCDHVHAAGLSGIHHSVKKPGAYGGYPFIELKEFLKMQASIVHLPRMRRQLTQILKKLKLDSRNED